MLPYVKCKTVFFEIDQTILTFVPVAGHEKILSDMWNSVDDYNDAVDGHGYVKLYLTSIIPEYDVDCCFN